MRYTSKSQCLPVQEPWARVICDPSNYHLLVLESPGYHIPAHRIDVVKGTVSSALHDIKAML